MKWQGCRRAPAYASQHAPVSFIPARSQLIRLPAPRSLLPTAAQVGTDIEPLSVKATQANAAHNGVAEQLSVYRCSPKLEAGEPLAEAGVPEEQRQFDVVVANILQASFWRAAGVGGKPWRVPRGHGAGCRQVPCTRAALRAWHAEWGRAGSAAPRSRGCLC
jgi:hypothetical protein